LGHGPRDAILKPQSRANSTAEQTRVRASSTSLPAKSAGHTGFVGEWCISAASTAHAEWCPAPGAIGARPAAARELCLSMRRGERRSGCRSRANAAGNLLPVALTGEAKTVVNLHAKPSFGRNAAVCSASMPHRSRWNECHSLRRRCGCVGHPDRELTC